MNEENVEERYRNIVSKSIEELESTDLIDVSYVKQSAKEDNKKILEEMEEIEQEYYGEELLQFIKRTDEQLVRRGRIQKRLFTLGEARERWEEFLERTEEWPNDYKPNETETKLLIYRFTEKTHFV